MRTVGLAAVGWVILASTSVGGQTAAPPPATTTAPPAAPAPATTTGPPAAPPSATTTAPPAAPRPATTTAPPAAPRGSPSATPADRGRFAAVWVAPLATHRFQGAGLEAGYRYRWLAGVYRLGFLQNGYASPEGVTPAVAQEQTQRLLLELEVGGQWRFHDNGTVGIGGGAAFLGDRVDILSMNGQTWTTTTGGRGWIRPVVSATVAGPIFQASVTLYVGPDPEARLSFGVCWGRHARPTAREITVRN